MAEITVADNHFEGGRNLADPASVNASGLAAILQSLNASSPTDLASTANGKGASLIGVEDAAALLDGATVEAVLAALSKGQGTVATAHVHRVRGIVTSNIADLAVFTVAGNDGLTYAAGERVLLAGQSTGAQNGIYVVGTVGGGTAALTRAADWAAAAVVRPGALMHVNEGTAYADTYWMITNTGSITVATTAPVYALIASGSGMDGRMAATVADANVVGGIPVLHRIAVPAGTTGDVDTVLTHKTLITDVWLVKTAAAGGGAGTIQVKNGSNAITDAMSIDVADKAVVRAATVDDAYHEIAAAGTLKITRTRTASTSEACTVYALGVRTA